MGMIRSPSSFSQMLRAGATKQELMQRFALSEEQYLKVVLCVERIHKEKEGETGE